MKKYSPLRCVFDVACSMLIGVYCNNINSGGRTVWPVIHTPRKFFVMESNCILWWQQQQKRSSPQTSETRGAETLCFSVLSWDFQYTHSKIHSHKHPRVGWYTLTHTSGLLKANYCKSKVTCSFSTISKTRGRMNCDVDVSGVLSHSMRQH